MLKKSFLKADIGIHIAFVLMIVVPTIFSLTSILKISVGLYIFYIIFINALYIIPIYINAYFWIPKYYKNNKRITYFIILLFASVLFVFIRILLDDYIMPRFGMNMNDSDFTWQFFFYFIRIIIYLAISFLLYSLQERYDQKQEITQARYEKLIAEMNHLKSQINPHFLFNTLNNLYGLALEKSDKTPEIILKLSKMMDYMLYETEEAKVYLKKDIENIKNFLDIEKIRQGNDAQIKFEYHGDITSQKIVPLLMLPLIENAFKYGVKDMISSGLVDIHLNIKGNVLELNIKNIYNLETPKSDSHGIGLANLKKRLELFYPGHHQLIVKNEPPYYNVNLTIEMI